MLWNVFINRIDNLIAKPKPKAKEESKSVAKTSPKPSPKPQDDSSSSSEDEAPKKGSSAAEQQTEKKPISALEALEQAAMNGDDDEFNLCYECLLKKKQVIKLLLHDFLFIS